MNKILSLIFIDRVANYMGEVPVIKNLFVEKYRAIYPEYNEGKTPTNEYINAIQGYYFAQKASGEFADNEGGVNEQKRIYELILKGREELLNIENPVQFIFSHSALGVVWDIPTLSHSKPTQHFRNSITSGNWSRVAYLCNQNGQRIYDGLSTEDSERVNQLTVIPNETYETFVTQYQEEIKSVYGTTVAGAGMTHTHKGQKQNEVTFKRNASQTIDAAFKRFWKALAKKTDYLMSFKEESLISNSIERINQIEIPGYVIEQAALLLLKLQRGQARRLRWF